MPSQALPRSSLLARVGRAFGLGSARAMRVDVGACATPRFEISNVAIAGHTGRGCKSRLVIHNSGGDCFDVGVVMGAKRVAGFASFTQGQSRRLTVVLPVQESLLTVKVIGFDVNGSPCERTFRRVAEIDGSNTFA